MPISYANAAERTFTKNSTLETTWQPRRLRYSTGTALSGWKGCTRRSKIPCSTSELFFSMDDAQNGWRGIEHSETWTRRAWLFTTFLYYYLCYACFDESWDWTEHHVLRATFGSFRYWLLLLLCIVFFPRYLCVAWRKGEKTASWGRCLSERIDAMTARKSGCSFWGDRTITTIDIDIFTNSPILISSRSA